MPSVTNMSDPITPATVAQIYRFVVGVDTHAATHSYAILDSTGAQLDEQTFPTTIAGIGRALDWIARRPTVRSTASWSPRRAPVATEPCSPRPSLRSATEWSRHPPPAVSVDAGRPTPWTQSPPLATPSPCRLHTCVIAVAVRTRSRSRSSPRPASSSMPNAYARSMRSPHWHAPTISTSTHAAR